MERAIMRAPAFRALGLVLWLVGLTVSHPVIAGTIYVDDDNTEGPWVGTEQHPYRHIQDGVSNSAVGDTVLVCGGIYEEDVAITHALDLISEPNGTTVIEDGGLNITAADVTVTGFAVRNGVGVRLTGASRNLINGNKITANVYGVFLISSSDGSVIEDNIIEGNGNWGVFVSYSRENVIRGNVIRGNGLGGVQIYPSSGRTLVEGNTISAHDEFGIQVYGSSNTIAGNSLSGNSIAVHLYSSTNNEVVGNTLMANGSGILLYGSSRNNLVYHNNLIRNARVAVDYGENNTWDNGYPSGGNFWFGYAAQDVYSGPNQDIPGSDGIGDVPFLITEGGNRDRYPLMDAQLQALAPPEWFVPGWVWFSIPLYPSGSTDASDVLGFDATNRLFGWDDGAKTLLLYPDDFIDLTLGPSYVARLPIGERYVPTYSGRLANLPFSWTLPAAGWSWVGVPAPWDIGGRSLSVEKDGVVRNTYQDLNSPDPWLNWNWIFWNPGVQTAGIMDPFGAGDDDTLHPWWGYRVWSNTEDVTIIFP